MLNPLCSLAFYALILFLVRITDFWLCVTGIYKNFLFAIEQVLVSLTTSSWAQHGRASSRALRHSGLNSAPVPRATSASSVSRAPLVTAETW